MPSLFHTLNLGSEALYATRQGVDTTGHNIANAQVEGYSRQRVNLKQRDPLERNNLMIGNGVYVGSISRLHDKFIENQINRANQEGGFASARAEGMKNLEVIFSPQMSASISDEMSGFFNSMGDLSNFPEDFTVRTAVVESARNLTASFRRVDSDLKEARGALNERVF
jgi:flagellar hook-associated protein 1 FlgK